jgi:RecA/RadA recombinase
MRPRSPEERRALLKDLRRQLAARFGAHVLLRWETARPQRGARALPTGSLALDLLTGIGGLPRGRLSELAGPPSSGKRTLAAHAVAQAQRGGDRGRSRCRRWRRGSRRSSTTRSWGCAWIASFWRSTPGSASS